VVVVVVTTQVPPLHCADCELVVLSPAASTVVVPLPVVVDEHA
jgi:hypothetical protein